MIFIVKDYFEGRTDLTKHYTEDMMGLKINNMNDTSALTFTVHSLTISVKPLDTFEGHFAPFRSVTINATAPYSFTVSAPYDPEADTVPPSLTITPEGTFTTDQTVTMSTEETATIYYTLDGTLPTTSSPVYSTPFTLTATTTIKAFAKDTSGNESAVQTRTFTRHGIARDGLVLHYNFTDKAGTSSNQISDTMQNLEAALVNVSHDGVKDGYIADRGLTLTPTGYVHIPSQTSAVKNSLDPNQGLTIVFTSYDTNGVLFRTDDNRFRVHTSAVLQAVFQYVSTDGTRKAGGYQVSSNLVHLGNGSKKHFHEILNRRDSEKVNTVAIRFNPDQTINLFVNEYKDSGSYRLPEDFAQYVPMLSERPLQLNANALALNVGSETIVDFAVYNKALPDEAMLQNYEYYAGKESLQRVSVYPNDVSIPPGEKQILYVQAWPVQYSAQLIHTYESGDEGIAIVSEEGMVTGRAYGETTLTVTSEYNGQIFTNDLPVTVSEHGSPPPSQRSIDGVTINRKTEMIKQGEAFALMATAWSSELPYDIYDDNIVVWESSDPTVAQVQYGVLYGHSPGTATLTVRDASRNYAQSFEVTVTEPEPIVITEEETYVVEAADYSIRLDDTDARSTTNGIQRALDDASAQGYKKIVFPKGTYRISPAVRTLYPPSDLIIDFNDSSLHIEPSELTAVGYVMFSFKHLKHTTLMRAHLYGEADSTTVQDSVEECVSVLFEDCLHSGFNSCTFSKSPGFNVLTEVIHNTSLGTPTQSISILNSNFEQGDIDENGEMIDGSHSYVYRYNQYMDVSGLGDTYLVGYTQGYHGYPYLRSRLYTMHFYDGNYQHLESHKYHLQYYSYRKPTNAAYAKIVIYQEDPPTAGDPDFGGAVAFMRTMGMPRHCFIKNCTFEDNFSTGLALCGGEGWLIEGNRFASNGGRMPSCDIDWEDGWEHMVGDVLRKNQFYSRIGVIMSAGSSLCALENTFHESTMLVRGRTQNYRVFNNVFDGKGAFINEFHTQGDSVLARNLFTRGAGYTTGKHHQDANYRLHEIKNVIAGGSE